MVVTLQEARELIEGFEAGTYPGSQWTHASHFVMALWYLHHFPYEVASDKIKNGIKAYNLSQGGINSETEGYHETLTEFFIRMIEEFRENSNGKDFIDTLNALLASPLIEKDFPLTYYTKAELFSKRARLSWLAPTRQPLLERKQATIS